MPHHQERPASALAHGPAKPSDIERVRREFARAEARRATREPVVERGMGEMATACQTIRKDLKGIKRVMEGTPPNGRPRGSQRSA
jgi:hypothetical protein